MSTPSPCPKCGRPRVERKSRNRWGEMTCLVCPACTEAKKMETLAAKGIDRQGRPIAPKAHPRAPSRLAVLMAPRLPWATPEVCAAVRVGIESPSAAKCGRFLVVKDNDRRGSLLTHVPTEKLTFPTESIVLTATLTETRRWKQLPAAHGGHR